MDQSTSVYHTKVQPDDNSNLAPRYQRPGYRGDIDSEGLAEN